jgi:hypothetical protein
MRTPSSIAGSLDYYRPRALRARSGRGLARFVSTMAGPRIVITSAQISQGGAGAGGSFSGGGAVGSTIVGNEATGVTYAICGYSVCDNANQVCGS